MERLRRVYREPQSRIPPLDGPTVAGKLLDFHEGPDDGDRIAGVDPHTAQNSDGTVGVVYTLSQSDRSGDPTAAPYVRIDPPCRSRTLFSGCDEYTSGQNPGTAHAGTLSMAPVGLGTLVTTGHVGDIRVFFCPSSTNMPIADVASGVRTFLEAADSLTEMKKAGGFDSKSMTHGEWDWLSGFSGPDKSAQTKTRAVMGQYHYRLLPTVTPRWYNTSGDVHNYMYGQTVRLLYTKPDRYVYPGEPVFKTQKMLGGRVIVTDTFSKNVNDSDGGIDIPGAGQWAHREGYNALYGDWHAKWYGDPQQRITYWVERNGSNGLPKGDTLSGGLAAMMLSDCDRANGGLYVQEGVVSVWHLFDVDAGIDVGVDDDKTW